VADDVADSAGLYDHGLGGVGEVHLLWADPPWSLLIFTFLIGCGTAVNNPDWQTSVRDMVLRQDLRVPVLAQLA
jgi:hypothetical protein